MRTVRRALACALAVVAAACGDRGPAGLRVVHRLVDPVMRVAEGTTPETLVTVGRPSFPTARGSTGLLPTATIADDTRTVLASHASAILAPRLRRRPRRGGRVTLQLPLPAGLASASALVLQTRIQQVTPKRPGWSDAPSVVAPVVVVHDGPVVRVELEVAAGATAVDLHVTAYRPAGTTRTEHRSAPVALPRGAVLDVAFGVLEPARDVGAVGFEVAACDEEARCDPVLEETIDPAAPGAAGWHDRRVPLGSHAGERRWLRFRTTDATGHSLPVWAHPTILAPAAERPASVLLLSIDTLRRDHLDLYGYARETAPVLRDFAVRGTVFEGLVAEAATTDPSHMTMFTSVPALVHGVTGGLTPLATPVTTLAEALRSAGHRTAAFTENGPLAHHRGFGLGFDEYTENKSASLLHPSGQVDRTFEQVRTWLARHDDEPFFLFVHTFQVHAPYAPPDRYGPLFVKDGADASVPPRGRGAARRYDREIRYVDDELARLVVWLTERDLLARTVLVITSDHGEEFYEHGSLGHGTLPWEQVLRVPLVVVGPGVPAGRREPGLVHHVDLMPTILALAGIPSPPGGHGRVVAPWLAGAGEPADGPLFSATWSLPKRLRPPAFAVRRGDHKLVRHRDKRGTHTALYDLRADPGERRTVDDAATARELGRLLDAWTARMADEAGERRAAAEPGAPSEAAGLDPEREEKLRSLGYID